MANLTKDVLAVYDALGGVEWMLAAAKRDGGMSKFEEMLCQTVFKASQLEKDKSDAEVAQRLKQLNFTYEQLWSAQEKVLGIVNHARTLQDVQFVPEEDILDPLDGKSIADEV